MGGGKVADEGGVRKAIGSPVLFILYMVLDVKFSSLRCLFLTLRIVATVFGVLVLLLFFFYKLGFRVSFFIIYCLM